MKKYGHSGKYFLAKKTAIMTLMDPHRGRSSKQRQVVIICIEQSSPLQSFHLNNFDNGKDEASDANDHAS